MAERCSETAGITQKYVAKLDLYNLAKLQGLIHAAGKLTAAFNSYIRDESTFSRGDIDHSFAVARYICELADR
ncbi:MAG: hypothetical protein ACI4FO_01430 [Acutalibacteraceae bacterium]